jgi:hypothetical protein
MMKLLPTSATTPPRKAAAIKPNGERLRAGAGAVATGGLVGAAAALGSVVLVEAAAVLDPVVAVASDVAAAVVPLGLPASLGAVVDDGADDPDAGAAVAATGLADGLISVALRSRVAKGRLGAELSLPGRSAGFSGDFEPSFLLSAMGANASNKRIIGKRRTSRPMIDKTLRRVSLRYS